LAGTLIAAGVISIIYLMLSALAMFTWDASGEGFLYRLFWGLLWFGYWFVIGLAFMIVAVPACWLLHVSGHKRVISMITVGVVLGFLFIVLGSFVASVAFTGTDQDGDWWKGTLVAAAIQAFAGGIVAWLASRSLARMPD
jgi:hypothetical protein